MLLSLKTPVESTRVDNFIEWVNTNGKVTVGRIRLPDAFKWSNTPGIGFGGSDSNSVTLSTNRYPQLFGGGSSNASVAISNVRPNTFSPWVTTTSNKYPTGLNRSLMSSRELRELKPDWVIISSIVDPVQGTRTESVAGIPLYTSDKDDPDAWKKQCAKLYLNRNEYILVFVDISANTGTLHTVKFRVFNPTNRTLPRMSFGIHYNL